MRIPAQKTQPLWGGHTTLAWDPEGHTQPTLESPPNRCPSFCRNAGSRGLIIRAVRGVHPPKTNRLSDSHKTVGDRGTKVTPEPADPLQITTEAHQTPSASQREASGSQRYGGLLVIPLDLQPIELPHVLRGTGVTGSREGVSPKFQPCCADADWGTQ